MTIKHGACTTQQTHASLDPARIFFVSLYLRPLLTHEELSICSRTGLVTSSVTATIEVLVLVVLLVFDLVSEVLAVDFLSSLRPADITCEPGKFLRKLLLRICGPTTAHLHIRS